MTRNSIALVKTWRCPSCRGLYGPVRQFGSTPRSKQAGPESPSYIDIPQPPQQPTERPAPVKGVLPVPRDIFRRRDGGTSRVTEEFINKTTKEPRKIADESASGSSRSQWKQRMAALRRRNFREGITELRDRRVQRDEAAALRHAENQAARERLIRAKEREDERLTSPTTTSLLQSGKGSFVLPDPDREERVAAMKARVQAKEEKRAADRQYALHTLYMHARNFITTEAQLDAAVDKAFGTTDEPKRWGRQGANIWYDKLPESAYTRLSKNNKPRSVFDEAQGNAGLTQKRIGRIAEELTGGKMD